MNRNFPDINYFIAITVGLIVLFGILFISGVAKADIPEDQAIRAIIGEASNQGYQGMLAAACGIRNRGTLKGVYGLKSKHIDKEPIWVWEMARKAYSEANKGTPVHDGTHWENIKAFGKPYWADKMIKVYEYKDHIFYKELI